MHSGRPSLRLSGYDYAEAGAYFFTTNTKGRLPILAEVRRGSVLLTSAGQVVHTVWLDLPGHYPHVSLDEFVVMPDHIHGILLLDPTPIGAAGLRPAAAEVMELEGVAEPGLPEIIRALKSFSARAINRARNTPGAAVWQRGYHERVIRSDEELARLREYIVNNPERAALDAERP